MKWLGREESSNVEDRRGVPGGGVAFGGGGVLLFVIAVLFGFDPSQVSFLLDEDPPRVAAPHHPSAEEERNASFTKVVLRDTEIVWEDLFRKLGRDYEPPTLVLFTGGVRSACGFADVAVGPFYCPADARIFIDLSFYDDMERELQASGEFARAYVIAHEVGHHVQQILGYANRGKQRRAQQTGVRLELQADFLAGVWAHHGQRRFRFLEPGDIESALNAAYQIGDDRLQRESQGYVVPDSFTHGTSRQRMRWFQEGFRGGDVRAAEKLFSERYERL